MADSPNYSFRRKPRFSANHVADYIVAETAGQRAGVIRSAKFPKKPQVVPYSRSRRWIPRFLAGNTGNLAMVDRHIDRLTADLSVEQDEWQQSEIRRNIAALQAFKKAFASHRLKRRRFAEGPLDMTMIIETVRINTRLDVTITDTDRAGATRSDGCVFMFANTTATRKWIEDRRKIVAAVVHWSLQKAGGNFEPIERLCLSFDIFGETITTAPTSFDRLRANIGSSCREAAAQWDGVAPPAGYDGPAWEAWAQ